MEKMVTLWKATVATRHGYAEFPHLTAWMVNEVAIEASKRGLTLFAEFERYGHRSEARPPDPKTLQSLLA